MPPHATTAQLLPTVMDHELGTEGLCAEVVYTAGSVRDVPHDQGFGVREPLQDVGDRQREHQQAWPHGNTSGTSMKNWYFFVHLLNSIAELS